MPFVSKMQARWMFANHPKMAKEFASKTSNIKSLPERVSEAKSNYKKRREKHGR